MVERKSSGGNNGMKKWVTLAMIVLLVIPIFNQTNVEAKSISKVQQELQELEKKQSELQSKRQNINQDKNEVKKKMDSNLSEQASLEQQLSKIEADLEKTEADILMKETEIETTNKEIQLLNLEIEKLTEEIAILQEKIEKREEILVDRLRSIQENGGQVQYIAVILGSQSFSDLITRSTAVNSIMDQDKNIMEEQIADQQALAAKQKEVEAKKENVESKKAALEEQKDSLQGLKNQLDEQKAEKKSIQEKLVAEYEELEEYNLSLEEEQQLIDNQAAVIEKAKQLAEEEKAKLEREAAEKANSQNQGQTNNSSTSSSGGSSNNSVIRTGNGTFIWPTAGGYMSSPFRPPHRPTHNGIDIAAGKGTPVVAAASGVVSTVVTGCGEGPSYHRCGGGFGNYVMVVHQINGQTFATLYAHLSSVSVSRGQAVSQGQQLGGVGNTGHSFGNHLHFEVHPGGYRNPANPMSYIK